MCGVALMGNRFTSETIFTPEIYYQSSILDRNLNICDIASKSLKRSVKKRPIVTGLDMCCGWGIIGASLLLKDVITYCHFTDIIPNELEDCQANIDACGLEERSKVYGSDVWQNINGKFDFIIANPPWYQNRVEYFMNLELREEAWLDLDWRWHKKFFHGLKEHLNYGGVCLLIEGSTASHVSVFEPMVEGLQFEAIQFEKQELKTSWIMEIHNV